MNRKTKMIVEGGIMLALAFVLNLITVFKMPQGGSITAGAMIPIFIFAIRWGGVRGVLLGGLFGAMQFLLGPKYSLHIVSVLGDYIAAYAFLGVAGFFGRKTIGIFSGIFIGTLLRYICHVLSGAVVFYEYAGVQNPWIYSAIYNITYLGPEMILSFILTWVILAKAPYLKEKL